MTVEIATSLSVHEALLRLRGLIRDSRDSTGRYPVVRGQVAGSQIQLMLTQRHGNSILRPGFSGSLATGDVGTRLIGEFGLSRLARLAVRVWTVFIVTWTLLSVIVALRSGLPELWWLPAIGAIVLASGAILLHFSKSYYRSDEAQIVELICGAINGDVKANGASR